MRGLLFWLLYAMKYWNFTLELLPSTLLSAITFPDGICRAARSGCFIFQSMSYVIDVYRGSYAPERNPLRRVCLHCSFRRWCKDRSAASDQLAPATAERKLCRDDLVIGIQLALPSYFKKIVIADRAAVLVNNVIMENCPHGGAVIAPVFCFLLASSCTWRFPGGIDITRGVARMFGTHMTLSQLPPTAVFHLAH